MRIAAVLCGGALVAGCYSPQLTDGLPCSETYDCPDELTCDFATLTCVTELPPSRRFANLAAGYRHACGIEFDSDADGGGTMWCWGDNTGQQLGVPGSRFGAAPVQIGDDDDWIAVSSGDNESLGIRADGSMWLWGEFETGLREVGTGTTWASVSAGWLIDCALDTDGAMTCGLLGGLDLAKPGTWKQVSVNANRVCAIDTEDRLFCWGNNQDGGVGDGTTDDAADPVEVMPGSAFVDVSTAYYHTCAVRDDGAAFCWGRCGFGQIGDGKDPLRACDVVTPSPAQVLGDSYQSISAFDLHTCAGQTNGDVQCWGLGEAGQTGSGIERHAEPRIVVSGGGWIEVAAGGDFTSARDGEGVTVCWGGNDQGQLGDGNGGDVEAPEQIAAGASWAEVRAGYRATCAIEVNGSLWCWGRNGRGELGVGDTRQVPAPRQVGGDLAWEDVAIGRDHGCGILGGTMYCWGAQTEEVTGGDLLVPTDLGAGDGWTEVAAMTWWSCGLKGAGELWCWDITGAPFRIGSDAGWSSLTSANGSVVQDLSICAVRDGSAYCLLGDPPTPTLLADNVTDWLEIDTGFSHICGIRGDGTVWCWGTNGAGELGDGTNTSSFDEAVIVDSTETWIDVAAGLNFTCAVDDDFELWCWGILVDSTSPVLIDVPGDFREVSAGAYHVCATRSDDTLWCWGSDDNDQLGRGLGGSTTPVRVLP